MKSLIFRLIALLCLNSILGCNSEFKNTEDRSHSELKVDTEAKSFDVFIEARIVPSTAPEKYVVYFSWPKIDSSRFIRIKQKQTLTTVHGNQTDFNHEVSHDQNLIYSFEILDPNYKLEKIFSKRVSIPKDIVIREHANNIIENSKLIANRLFLTGDSKLITNGYNTEIEVNEIYSDSGVIESFPLSAKAKLDVPGKSAGLLTIKAKAAFGDLKIYMRGEDGGDGSAGESYTSPAPSGKDAGLGVAECDTTGKDRNLTCFCTEYGANAENGKQGSFGKNGKPAQNGGDSGTLKVFINDGKDFQLEAFHEIGIAGLPGAGGDGQLGGAGGKLSNSKCSGSSGKNGSQGPKGISGASAEDGKVGSICIYIASEGKNDCY